MLFGKESPLRHATPTLQRSVGKQKCGCGSYKPLVSALSLFFFQDIVLGSIDSDGSERVVLISWHCDRLIVLPWM